MNIKKLVDNIKYTEFFDLVNTLKNDSTKNYKQIALNNKPAIEYILNYVIDTQYFLCL